MCYNEQSAMQDYSTKYEPCWVFQGFLNIFIQPFLIQNQTLTSKVDSSFYYTLHSM